MDKTTVAIGHQTHETLATVRDMNAFSSMDEAVVYLLEKSGREVHAQEGERR